MPPFGRRLIFKMFQRVIFTTEWFDQMCGELDAICGSTTPTDFVSGLSFSFFKTFDILYFQKICQRRAFINELIIRLFFRECPDD